MKRLLHLLFCLPLFVLAYGQNITFHDFKVKDIQGNEFDLASLKGKKVLVVNVASKCGLTPQYKVLQAMQERYGDDKFTVIAFPANNFGQQEPGTNKEIEAFCTHTYNVTFPVMEKISVKGNDMAPVYQWLTQKSQNELKDSEVTWNFQKYLIDEEGCLVDFTSPRTQPDDPRIIEWIEGE